jgi:hypothetical protein
VVKVVNVVKEEVDVYIDVDKEDVVEVEVVVGGA